MLKLKSFAELFIVLNIERCVCVCVCVCLLMFKYQFLRVSFDTISIF